MAPKDVLHKLEEEAEKQAKALELTKLYYNMVEAAKILGISRAKLDRYLNSEDFQIEKIGFENDRKKYMLAEDIRRLYVFLHTPYLNSSKPKTPLVQSAGEAALQRHLGPRAQVQLQDQATQPLHAVTRR